jgi:hypothetical protein
MIRFRLCVKNLCGRKILAVPVLTIFLSTAALAGTNITGTVRNGSRGQAAAGEEVILLRIDNGETEARAKTDDRGTFTFAVQAPDKPYLVRVLHQDVSYDQRAAAGDALSILVYDAAPQVTGITGSIEILRAGTNGKRLHISDLYEVKNESSPPLTQAGERTFEVYLPPGAKIDSVLAAGLDRIGVMISALPVPGEPGHYAVNFPLRPGATKFAFKYELPYDGHAALETRHAYALQQLAVMIPLSMQFSLRSQAFQVLATGNSRYQVLAANQLKAGAGPAFEISGEGQLPPLIDQPNSVARSPSSAISSAAVQAAAQGVLASRGNFDSPLRQILPPSQTLLMGGVTAVLLAASVFMVWRARKNERITRVRQ